MASRAAGRGGVGRTIGVPVVVSGCVDRAVGVGVAGTALADLFCAESLENAVLVTVNGFVLREGVGVLSGSK
jgi:hypothetical protein